VAEKPAGIVPARCTTKSSQERLDAGVARIFDGVYMLKPFSISFWQDWGWFMPPLAHYNGSNGDPNILRHGGFPQNN